MKRNACQQSWSAILGTFLAISLVIGLHPSSTAWAQSTDTPDVSSIFNASAPAQTRLAIRWQTTPWLTANLKQEVARQVEQTLALTLHDGVSWTIEDDWAQAIALLSPTQTADTLTIEQLTADNMPTDGRSTLLAQVRWSQGQYEVKLRQWEPLSKRLTETVSWQGGDRRQLGEALARMIARQYSPRGLFVGYAGPKQILVKFEGAGKAPGVFDWLKGQWFEPVALLPPESAKPHIRRVPHVFATFREARGSVALMDLVSNRGNPISSRMNGTQFVLRRLHAQAGRPTIRIVDETSGRPLPGWNVSVANDPSQPKDFVFQGTTDPKGRVTFRTPTKAVALVELHRGARTIRLPIAVSRASSDASDRSTSLGGRASGVEVVRIPKAPADALVPFFRQSTVVLDYMNLLSEHLDSEFKRFAQLQNDPQNLDQIGQDGEKLARRINLEVAEYQRDINQLGSEWKDQDRAKAMLVTLNGKISYLRSQNEQLRKYLDNVEQAKSTREARDLTKLALAAAQQHLAKLDIEQALEKYRLARRYSPKNADIQKQITKLEKAWKTGDPELQKARDFFYSPWYTLSTELAQNMDTATKQLEVLVKHKDVIGYLKFLDGLEELVNAVKQMKQLAGDTSQLSDKDREQLNELSQKAKVLSAAQEKAQKAMQAPIKQFEGS